MGDGVLPDFLSSTGWYMSMGERAAVVGVLAALRPAVSIEIGTADGGSLKPAAAYSGVVHSFDLRRPPDDAAAAYANVVFHTGDCHELLPPLLERFRTEGVSVNYAMVDGDHSARGANTDVRTLLDSGVMRGVILAHDVANPHTRKGLKGIRFEDYPDVRYVDLDFVSGHFLLDSSERNQLWGGLAMIIVGVDPEVILDPGETGGSGIRQAKYRDNSEVLGFVRQVLLAPAHARYVSRHPAGALRDLRRRLERL